MKFAPFAFAACGGGAVWSALFAFGLHKPGLYLLSVSLVVAAIIIFIATDGEDEIRG